MALGGSTPIAGAGNTARYTPVMTVPIPGAASAAPVTAYSGTFIPEIWSSKMIDAFYDATVLGVISNTDYEGEISNYGDTIHIRTEADITIKDYLPDAVLEVERPSAATVELYISEGHYFNTILDDVWKVQSDMDLMNQWAKTASEKMKIQVDSNVLAYLPTTAHADNLGATAGRISNNIDLGATAAPQFIAPAATGTGTGASNSNYQAIIDHILDLGQVLDEQNVPETDRFIVMPSWAGTMLKKSELRDASLTGDGTSILRNGRLGMIDRFTLYASNLVPAGAAGPGVSGEFYMIAGTPAALTFAAQMTRMETLRSESTFGTLMRGLMVYGAETIKPEALAVSVVSK